MKYLNFYNEVLGCKNEDDVFNYLLDNLKPSTIVWKYFVNWDKVFNNTQKIEIALNNLNYLIGKKDFDKEFRYLIKENPHLAKVIPALAVRDGHNTIKFKILVDYTRKKLIYDDYDFDKENLTDEDIEKYLTFAKETGLKQLIVSQKIKNLVDYMIGVEAGLDSNGRKNRGGHAMEKITEVFIEDVCKNKGYKYLKEANADKIKSELGYTIPVGESSRRYDFAVDNGKELFIIETNFYGGSGSKIKSTADEYKSPFDLLKNACKFIWITDGLGWKKTARSLREIFNYTDYVFSLAMLENGALEFMFLKNNDKFFTGKKLCKQQNSL